MANEIVVLDQPPWADPWAHPEFYAGITVKRVLAYAIDLMIVAALAVVTFVLLVILGFLTFGLAWHLLWVPGGLLPLAYHSLLIGGPRAATLGMRAMGIHVASLLPETQVQGGRPTMIQAIIQTVGFYASMLATGSLILLVALFNPRRRTAHDWLAKTVVINDV